MNKYNNRAFRASQFSWFQRNFFSRFSSDWPRDPSMLCKGVCEILARGFDALQPERTKNKFGFNIVRKKRSLICLLAFARDKSLFIYYYYFFATEYDIVMPFFVCCSDAMRHISLASKSTYNLWFLCSLCTLCYWLLLAIISWSNAAVGDNSYKWMVL